MRRAFTLLELAAVLALIGLLSAAAVPALSRMVNRGRASEAVGIVEAIAHGELRHFRDRGRFLACPPTPAAPPAGTTALFDGRGPWQALGVEIVGPVRYSYAVELVDGSFRVTASGDLDGDGVLGHYALDGRTMLVTEHEPLE
ncbi:MAG: prepilin-type N-terminal cleavage/methylation domain-containing protein [Deltaproteobacteria bacterium]|nr:prepilin-type N-terminal cleavage/methylation domain-containing protein [Deltaproteobacteria bacterium]